jgi:hypothetical protein
VDKTALRGLPHNKATFSARIFRIVLDDAASRQDNLELGDRQAIGETLFIGVKGDLIRLSFNLDTDRISGDTRMHVENILILSRLEKRRPERGSSGGDLEA